MSGEPRDGPVGQTYAAVRFSRSKLPTETAASVYRDLAGPAVELSQDV